MKKSQSAWSKEQRVIANSNEQRAESIGSNTGEKLMTKNIGHRRADNHNTQRARM